jgi:hypothetical protein
MVSWGLALIRSPIMFSSLRSSAHSLNMFSTSIIRQVLASYNVTSTVDSSSCITNMDGLSLPCTSDGQITKTRKPSSGNSYASSSFCPHVIASKDLHCWITPHALSHHDHVISKMSLAATSILMEVMLSSLEPKTRSNYGAGLLCFTQFCDQLTIPEQDH